MKDRFVTAQPWLGLVARLVLAEEWIRAGWPKLLDSESTIRSVRGFKLLPEVMVRPFGYGLPLVELALALLLLLGIATRIGALLTAGMMVMFLFGISQAWARGLEINCGCYGDAGATVTDPVKGYVIDLVRDTVFLGLSVFLVRWPFTKFSVDGILGLTRREPVTADT